MRTVCKVFEDMRKTIKYLNYEDIDDLKFDVDRISDFIEEIQEMVNKMDESLQYKTELLKNGDYIDCPKCGWEEVYTDEGKSNCVRCGLWVVRKDGLWKVKEKSWFVGIDEIKKEIGGKIEGGVK